MGVLKITESILTKFTFHETLTESRVTCWPKTRSYSCWPALQPPSQPYSLNTISQVEHHLIDLGLQGIHFSTGFNRDESREIAIHRRSRDLSKASHLRCQVRRHGVDGQAKAGHEFQR
jgi:hypothetical protein